MEKAEYELFQCETHTLSPYIHLSISPSLQCTAMKCARHMSERFFACSVLFCSVSILFGVVAAVVVHTNEGKRGTRP